MTDKLEDLRITLEQQSTESLVAILRNRDEEEWRPEAFQVAAAILRERGVSPDEVIAQGPEDVVVPESEYTVAVATFFSPAHAHACQGALEDAGLQAWVVDEMLGTMYAVGIGTRVLVRQQDLEAAQAILDGLDDVPVTADALPPEMAEPPCPACGSAKVTQFVSMDDGLWTYRCTECSNEWPDDDEPG
jgi:hypothetical protein